MSWLDASEAGSGSAEDGCRRHTTCASADAHHLQARRVVGGRRRVARQPRLPHRGAAPGPSGAASRPCPASFPMARKTGSNAPHVEWSGCLSAERSLCVAEDGWRTLVLAAARQEPLLSAMITLVTRHTNHTSKNSWWRSGGIQYPQSALPTTPRHHQSPAGLHRHLAIERPVRRSRESGERRAARLVPAGRVR
jgi:hypothetical protein